MAESDEKIFNDNRGFRTYHYPSVEEQLDMIWHGIEDGHFSVDKENSAFYNAVKQIKDDNPKPDPI